MSIFKKAEKTQAYLKMGIMGFTGSGKTYTASSVAIGLWQYVKENQGLELPVYFLDTETGSDYVQPRFEGSGIELMQAKTRAFADLVPAVNEASKNGGILLIDSITHFWVELQESYMAKKKRTRLMFQDWAWLKSKWRTFTDVFVNSEAHIIMCGRAGFEYDFFEDEAGKKELEKTGIKMKAETETGYEPSILVLMHREQDMQSDGTTRVRRKAVVLKDRALGVNCLDGQIFYDPTFENFKPHVDFLNIGGKQLGFVENRSTDMVPDDDPKWALEKRQKEICLDEIQCILVKHYPSTKQVDKAAKGDLLEKFFESRSWERIKSFKLDELRAGYNALFRHLEPEKDDQYSEPIGDAPWVATLNDRLEQSKGPDEVEMIRKEFADWLSTEHEKATVDTICRNFVNDHVSDPPF